MSNSRGFNKAALIDHLNRCMPAAHDVQLGQVLADLIGQHNALLAHLDSANVAGVGNGNVAAYSVKDLDKR